MSQLRRYRAFAFAVATLAALLPAARADFGTGFTYQGELKLGGVPLNSPIEASFLLFDAPAAGTLIGGPDGQLLDVRNGLFTTTLNASGQFGPYAFDGGERWLQVMFGPTMLPRQRITPTPYALFSAAPWRTGAANTVNYPGKVGIGTTAPGMTVEATTPSYYGGPALGGANGGHWAYLHFAADHSFIWDNQAAMRFGTETSRGAGYTEWMRISPIGRVGIGVTNPQVRLHVVGSDASTVAQFENSSTAANTRAIYGACASPDIGIGVHGSTSATTGTTYGVFGAHNALAGAGVIGQCYNTLGDAKGVWGVQGPSSSGYAGYFSGRMAATGTKMFQIDHPRDPEHKYLNHYCTEGAEPLNAYSGNVTTDARGEAWITLPDYFADINRDVRYLLTVIDDSDDVVTAKVKRPIADNRFLIRANKPGVQVSWRVEGVRNDEWVRKHGAPVEEPKLGVTRLPSP